jgi:hypothetical protein
MIRHAGKTKLSTIPPLAAKLTPLTASLTSVLLGSLSLPTNRKSTVVNLISLLLRLNAGPAARSTFLAARTEVMRKHVRAIRFEGHIGMYINDLAVVMFTGIKHTADWFLASFKENEVASCKFVHHLIFSCLVDVRQASLIGQSSRLRIMRRCSGSRCIVLMWNPRLSRRHCRSRIVRVKRFVLTSSQNVMSDTRVTAAPRIRPRLPVPP